MTQLAAGQNSHRWPQFLPDGHRFIFSMVLGEPQTRGVYVASLDGGNPTRILPAETGGAYAPGYLLRVSQGVLIAQPFDTARLALTGEPFPVAQAVGVDEGVARGAFSVSAAGMLAHRAGAAARRQLVWVDRAGKALEAVGSPDESALANPALAPDGQRLALNRTVQGNLDIWLTDIGRGLTSRFSFDGAVDTRPIWSPDGSKVVFASSRKGVVDLFEKPMSGAADEQPLLVTPQNKYPLDWSPDGRLLLYAAQDPKTNSDLWVLPFRAERSVARSTSSGSTLSRVEPSTASRPPAAFAEGSKPFPVVQTSFDEIAGQFSPDARWLAFASNESGRYEIYVRPFPEAGGKWQVSTAGGLQPRWNRDGTELFYVAPDNRLMAVPIRVAPEQRAVVPGAPAALFSTRLSTGSNIAAGTAAARAQYAIAPDGRFLMNVTADDAVTSPITIVLNWEAALARK